MPKIDKTYHIDARHLPGIVEHLRTTLRNEGYEVRKVEQDSGEILLAITKTDVFKAVAGFRTAFRCSFLKAADGIRLTGKIGMFDQETRPPLLLLALYWPIILSTITGYIKSRKLDRHILDVIDGYLETLVP